MNVHKAKTLFLVIAALFYSLYQFAQISTYQAANMPQMNRWVDSVYQQMSLDERVGQLFMAVAEPNQSYKNRINNFIEKQKIGGIYFSKGSLLEQAQITNYTQSISKIPLFVAADAEWGLAMRLSDTPKFPRNMTLGAIENDSLLYAYGREVAREARAMEIHISFAPVMDVNSNPRNPVIGTRSFGENPDNVARKGIAYAKGLEDGGVISVAKHFPGHGDTNTDSHKTLPTIAHDYNRLTENELYPFKKYIDAKLSGIMIGHLDVPALKTNGLPASLSPEIGTELLQNQLGFSGLIFTDGMAMRGVSSQSDISVRAILAGNDIVLGVVNQEAEFEAVKSAIEKGTISQSLLENKVKKILSFKYLIGLHDYESIETRNLKTIINLPQSKWLCRKLYDNSVVLLKNENDLIPLKSLDKRKIASVAIGASAKQPVQRWLNKYADVTIFQASSMLSLAKLSNQLNKFDVVIYSIHSKKFTDSQTLIDLTKKQNAILAFFTSPYELAQYTYSSDKATSIIWVGDDSEFAQASVAQAIFGGITVSGKFPVSAGNFTEGAGEKTEKIRLSYQLPEETSIDLFRLNNIDMIAEEGIRKHAYPGCHILIAKDGIVIYDKSFGYFDYKKSKKVLDKTVYDLASVTKAAATLPAVMKLYDDDNIQLSDKISRFYTPLRGSDKSYVTVREALFHESGITPFIPYYMAAIDENSYEGALFSGKKSAVYSKQFAGSWGRGDFKFKPGMIAYSKSVKYPIEIAKGVYVSKKLTQSVMQDVIGSKMKKRGKYAYSCLNFMLLKEMVESISKTDLNTFLQENFYKKLGMTSTTFQPTKYMSRANIAPTERDDMIRRQTLQGYVHDEGSALLGGISGNAGLFSNANDLAKLCQMWLNGGTYGGERFLSQSTVKMFTTMKSAKSRRGLGFDKPDLRDSDRSPCGILTPITVYGHTGYTGTAFWIDPTNNLIYIFLSNRVYPSRTPNELSSLEIRQRIQDEIYLSIKK